MQIPQYLANRTWPGFFLVLLLVLTVLPRATQAGEAYFSEDLKISIPTTLGGLPLVDVTDYESRQRGLGIGLSYRKDGIKADLYIYTAGQPTIPSGIASPLMKSHFYAVSRDVVEMERLGHYRDVQVLTPSEEVSVGPVKFLHADLRFTQENVPMESHVYLTGLANRFVKIRFSFPEAKATAGQTALASFLQELGKILPAASQ